MRSPEKKLGKVWGALDHPSPDHLNCQMTPACTPGTYTMSLNP